MYCVMRASVPSLYNVYQRYDDSVPPIVYMHIMFVRMSIHTHNIMMYVCTLCTDVYVQDL